MSYKGFYYFVPAKLAVTVISGSDCRGANIYALTTVFSVFFIPHYKDIHKIPQKIAFLISDKNRGLMEIKFTVQKSHFTEGERTLDVKEAFALDHG